MFHKILICTDFQDGLQRLVRFVPALAKSGLQQIIFCHVVPLLTDRDIPKVDTRKMETAQERLSVALENVPEGVDVKVEVGSGRFVDTVLKWIDTYQSDLVLLGMQQRTLLNEKLFGSNTVELTQRLGIPLMSIRPPLISTYTNEELELRCQHLFRSLLIPYDGSNEGNALLERIAEYARNRSANSLQECVLVQVLDTAGQRRAVRQEDCVATARQQMEPMKAKLEALGLQVQIEAREGDPLAELLEMAIEYDITAIAIAARTLSNKLLDWSRPKFSAQVLRSSWHPVIFFPPKR
ncbi:MAG: universal stress protein [Cyanobacteria bacterium J055]|nr:MAG: universal stress protein [Cyanobacteria bacterium J055]